MFLEYCLGQELLDKAIPLDSIGFNELAWDKKTVLEVLTNLIPLNVGIWGGDVYELIGDDIIPLSDSWYCEIEMGEDEKSFFLRSILHAQKYINDFPDIPEQKILFTLVLTRR